MKILLLNDHFPPWGTSSVASIVESLSKSFRAKGHTVKILTAHQEPTSDVLRNGDVIRVPSGPPSRFPHSHNVFSSAVAKVIEPIIAEEKPDVVHAHNIHTFLTYKSLEAAHKHCAKVCITFHDVMSFSYARLNTKQYLDHGDTRLTLLDHLERARWHWNPLRNAKIRSLIATKTFARFAVSDALKQALDANGIVGSQVVHNGIDLHAWQPDLQKIEAFKKRHDLDGRTTILFGGRLSLDKGIGPMMEALKKIRTEVPSVTLLIVGDPKRWERLVANENREILRSHCKALGWLTQEEMKTACFACDIVTSPSLCLDCFPTMNIEAMAAGKPVVGTIFGGTKEAVQDGVTGFVCDPRNTELFSFQLLKLLQDPALRETMGRAGRARVEHEFTIDKQADEYLKAYGA